ncbi:hypothetical protein ACPPVU_11010 [Mucilaginibacter sp. McL0603]|uniref:hypothetical protein n=1 Tax=Mucilaginibacter sp. McL0603 TaxID=3415670 RepID=UPI003CEE9C3F
MTLRLNVIEIPALIPKKINRKIVFADSGISIEKPFSIDSKIFIPCENISAFRFGIEGMHFLKMTFCRQYFLEIKDDQNKIFRIKLNSYYGLKREMFFKIWADLLDQFWNNYMLNQLSFYTELFNIQQTFELSGVTFYPDGISWDDDVMLKWSEIAVSSYQTHFVIHHIDDISQSKCCVFSIHWNAVVLQSLLKEIIKQPIKARKSSWL